MKNRKEERSGENERKRGKGEGRKKKGGKIAFPPFFSVCSYLVFPTGVGMRC